MLLDWPITRYYGEIEPTLEVVPGAMGEVQYAIAVKKGDLAFRDALNGALDSLAQAWFGTVDAALTEPETGPAEAGG